MILDMWCFTVFSLRDSESAISLFDFPAESNSITSISRLVKSFFESFGAASSSPLHEPLAGTGANIIMANSGVI